MKESMNIISNMIEILDDGGEWNHGTAELANMKFTLHQTISLICALFDNADKQALTRSRCTLTPNSIECFLFRV